ncbi:MAG: chorismate--pyruvate lyase family protein [Chromatiales bacterium]
MLQRRTSHRRAFTSSLSIYGADISRLLRSLLLERGSLTRRLVTLAEGRFRVRVDREQWRTPNAEEARVLGLRSRRGIWIREVTLLCARTPMVYARSVIPAAALRGRFRRLTRLGERPLGEFLFTDKAVARGRLQLLRITRHHSLYGGARRRAGCATAEFWGRRSLYYIGSTTLLVAEIFLTDVGR